MANRLLYVRILFYCFICFNGLRCFFIDVLKPTCERSSKRTIMLPKTIFETTSPFPSLVKDCFTVSPCPLYQHFLFSHIHENAACAACVRCGGQMTISASALHAVRQQHIYVVTFIPPPPPTSSAPFFLLFLNPLQSIKILLEQTPSSKSLSELWGHILEEERTLHRRFEARSRAVL